MRCVSFAKVSLIAFTERSPSDTRRMPRTGWSSPPRWPPGRAACRRTDLVRDTCHACHLSRVSFASPLTTPSLARVCVKQVLSLGYSWGKVCIFTCTGVINDHGDDDNDDTNADHLESVQGLSHVHGGGGAQGPRHEVDGDIVPRAGVPCKV